MFSFPSFKAVRRFCLQGAAIGLLSVALSGCMALDMSEAPPKLSSKLIAEMTRKGMKPESPVLVRIFKQESELEVWKIDRSGKFALLKTFPICRWSGDLGPKRKSGDRHAPEGFYHVTAGMLNPNSQFYVSFNLGYPNRLESALGYTGEALMVHGACSSSGCYAMTDQGVGDIYAIVAKALESGQASFQVQAFPFRMTGANMAAHRGDANMSFWRVLKEGYDSFEITRRQPKVSACGSRYVFNQAFPGGEPTDPLAPCPPSTSGIEPQALAKIAEENHAIDALIGGPAPIMASTSAYLDGGMHPVFRTLLKQAGAKSMAAKVSGTKYPISRPEAALADPFAGQD
jgi:murein L,D-transpeptidase YafK